MKKLSPLGPAAYQVQDHTVELLPALEASSGLKRSPGAYVPRPARQATLLRALNEPPQSSGVSPRSFASFVPPLANISRSINLSAADLNTLDWTAISHIHRSKNGQYGVRFLEISERYLVAAKTAHNIDREHLAEQLARAVGLRTASPSILLQDPCMALCEATSFWPKEKVLIMPRLDGVSFRELTPTQENALVNVTALGLSIFYDLGAVFAYDCFIGNDDRFPSLGGQNRGNLMLPGDRVTLIDNTMASKLNLAKPCFRETYSKKLRQILRHGHANDPALATRCFQTNAKFLPPELEITWESMAAPFLAGFRQGVRLIAALPTAKLESIMVASQIDEPTQNFVRDNHAAFRAATGSV
jgi:hypothetical protein